MPSQRNEIGVYNANGSKNTRMDFSKLQDSMDYRKDEIMHIARYTNAAKTMEQLSKKLNRPIRVLDVGCGEMNSVRLFYKAMLGKKSETLEEYVGVDIDYVMVQNAMEKYGRAYKVCNARFHIQDLTQNSHIDVPDGYYDLVLSFEFLEHIQPEFAPAILSEMRRVLSKGGKALISTPNSNGSNKKLPKDHIYEYSYQELIQMFNQAGFKVTDTVGVCINISKIPKNEIEEKAVLLRKFYKVLVKTLRLQALLLRHSLTLEIAKMSYII